MKKMTTTLSALTIAAALMMGLTACTNDDNIAAMTEQPEAVSQQTTVHVTVGAGIGDDATTRAAVTQEGTTRTLTFTEGDRLYITEGLYGGETTKYLVGYLNMVGSPSADGKSATFSGDLSVVLAGGTPSTYDFGDADPLSVAVSKAWFVPADASAGFILDNIYTIPVNDAKMIAADVNTLMKSALYVKGDYNSSTKSFSLSANKPILNCTIGNLKENTEYTVKLRFASNQSDYESNNYIDETTYDAMTVTSDGDGFARFAISGLTTISAMTYNFYYALQFVPVVSGATKTYILGQKDLGAKVYNLSRSYGTCSLTVNVQEDNGGVVSYGSCDAITVKIGDKVIYQTPSNGMMTWNQGQTTISFLTEVVSNATLTVIGTKTTGSGTVTYTGTATGVNILYKQTTNVGPVNLVKQ